MGECTESGRSRHAFRARCTSRILVGKLNEKPLVGMKKAHRVPQANAMVDMTELGDTDLTEQG